MHAINLSSQRGPLSISLILREAGANPSWHWARGGVHPGQVNSQSQGLTYRDRHPLTLRFTPMGNLESPFNLTCMSLDCGRKPDYPEKTHAGTWRTVPTCFCQARDIVAIRNSTWYLQLGITSQRLMWTLFPACLLVITPWTIWCECCI